jgi:hypothetical protein
MMITTKRLLTLCVVLGSSVAAGIAQLTQIAASTELTRFYAVSQTFWDNGPMWDYHILEAKRVGNETLVRDILIVSAQSPCGLSCTVKAKIKQLHNTTPAELVGDNNPCAIDQREIRRELRRTR